MKIVKVRIHPAIGIARVGNSPDEFFIGPELPGDRSIPPGGYKDDKCRVRRQAARFYIFAYYDDKSYKEITSEQAEITWTVELANKKAYSDGRNPTTVTERDKDLIIQPGERTVTGPDKRQTFDTGRIKFSDCPEVIVPLGEIRTDKKGRLTVLGGFGKSGCPKVPPVPIDTFYYTPDWYDDISDGPITASVKIRTTGETFEAEQAWVIVAPPKFAPGIDNITTLYDRLIDMGVTAGWVSLTNSFYTAHIYPILERARKIKWVYDASGAHSWPDDPIIDPIYRNKIFSKLTAPDAATIDMPFLHEGGRMDGRLTRTQYKFMEMWNEGAFKDDWAGPPSPASEITPDGLDQAALENAVGGPFYPGIEVGGITECPVLERTNYTSLFRFDTKLKAGDLTAFMAVPWQADFKACADNWWPVPRPNQVIPEGSTKYQVWDRDDCDMVESWHTLGFVVEKGKKYVEVDRCECKSVTLVTPHLDFSDVPQGPMGASTSRALPIIFEVRSKKDHVTFEFQSGPHHRRLKRRSLSVSLSPTVGNEIAIARLWVTYETGPVEEVVNDNVVICNPADGKSWEITITANTVIRKRAGIAMVIDGSDSMSESRGDIESKHKAVQQVSASFVDTMLEGDELALIRFNDVPKLLQELTTLGSPLDISHNARANAKNILMGLALNPSSNTSVGNGIYEGHKALMAGSHEYGTKAMVIVTRSRENCRRWISEVSPVITEQIYAIGIGTPENVNIPILQTLSGNHDGYILVTGSISDDSQFILHKYLLQIHADVNKLQTVMNFRTNLVPGKEQQIPFYLTEADTSVDIIVLTKYPDYIDLRLRTPNFMVINSQTTPSGIHYVKSKSISYFRIKLPVELEPMRPDHGGVWQANLVPKNFTSEKDNKGIDNYKIPSQTRWETAGKGRKIDTFQMLYNVPCGLIIQSYSNLYLQVSLRQTSYEPGASVYLNATVLQSGAPLESVTYVWAEVTRPDGSIRYLTLSEKEEGQFSGIFDTTAAGIYSIRIRCSGISNLGYPFQREHTRSAVVWHGGDLEYQNSLRRNVIEHINDTG